MDDQLDYWISRACYLIAILGLGILIGRGCTMNYEADRACAEACGMLSSDRSSGHCRCVYSMEPKED